MLRHTPKHRRPSLQSIFGVPVAGLLCLAGRLAALWAAPGPPGPQGHTCCCHPTPGRAAAALLTCLWSMPSPGYATRHVLAICTSTSSTASALPAAAGAGSKGGASTSPYIACSACAVGPQAPGGRVSPAQREIEASGHMRGALSACASVRLCIRTCQGGGSARVNLHACTHV